MLGANTMWGLMSPISKMVMAGSLVTPFVVTELRVAGAMLLFRAASSFTKSEHVNARDLLSLFAAFLIAIAPPVLRHTARPASDFSDALLPAQQSSAPSRRPSGMELLFFLKLLAVAHRRERHDAEHQRAEAQHGRQQIMGDEGIFAGLLRLPARENDLHLIPHGIDGLFRGAHLTPHRHAFPGTRIDESQARILDDAVLALLLADRRHRSRRLLP